MDKRFEIIYTKLPISFQNLACSYEGWKIQKKRYPPAFMKVLADVESRSYLSNDELESFRDLRLQSFVQNAVTTVPYYRTLFRDIGIEPQDIRTLADMQQLPIMDKPIVRDNYENLVSKAIRPEDTTTFHTRGTTGSPLVSAVSKQAMLEQWAIRWRFRRWHGVQLDTPAAFFTGRSIVPIAQTQPPFWRYNRPGRQILFSSFHMSSANLPSYVDALRKHRPSYIQGYPTSLALLSSHLLETGSDLGYQPRWVFTNSETLLPNQEDIIARALGVHPRQRYGSAEAVAEISECENGKLHVDEDVAAAEFIPTEDDQVFRVVGTNLSNPAVPLLRYELRDLVFRSGATCSCGHPGRIVDSIEGRLDDYVILKDGRRQGRIAGIPEKLRNVVECQVYQKVPGEIDIRVVRGSNYAEADDAVILYEARKRVGDDTKITIKYVDTIERTRNGKVRFVVSDIEEGQLEKMR